MIKENVVTMSCTKIKEYETICLTKNQFQVENENAKTRAETVNTIILRIFFHKL